MLTCPLLRAALVAQFLIDKNPLAHSQKKTGNEATGFFDLPSGLRLQIMPSIENFVSEDWDDVVPEENFFLKWNFLAAFEKNAPANMKFHYALVGDGKKNSAAFYFQVIHLTSEEITYIIKPLTSGVKPNGFGAQLNEWVKKSRGESGFRLLISGNNFISGEYGVGMKKDADAEKVFTALAETIKVITENDRENGKISAILVKDYFEEKAKENADFIRRKRYHRFKVEPEMVVEIPSDWKTFEDYLEAMSKKYRHRAKSVLKKTGGIISKELTADEIEKYGKHFFDLYHNVHDRAKFRLALLSENYFAEMKKEFPSEFHVYAYELNGKIVGFRSTFYFKDQHKAHFIGVDYSVNEKLPLYQRILYDYIRDGIESGNKNVFLGRTAAEMKSTVGAVPHDLVCYIRHRNSFSNQVIRPFIDYLKPSPWVPRNPFKESN